MKKNKKVLSIVFPVFENEKNLPHLYSEIIDFKKQFNKCTLQLIFIDDGSKDNSFLELQRLKKNWK